MAKASRLERDVYQLLRKYVEDCGIGVNLRPDWLIMPDGTRLELDFYVERFGLAIEIQGAHHYRYVPFYHKSPEGFKKQLERDRFKREACESQGMRLIEVSGDLDVPQLKEALDELSATKRRQRYQPFTRAEIAKARQYAEAIELVQAKVARPDLSPESRKNREDKLRDIEQRLTRLLTRGWGEE